MVTGPGAEGEWGDSNLVLHKICMYRVVLREEPMVGQCLQETGETSGDGRRDGRVKR